VSATLRDRYLAALAAAGLKPAAKQPSRKYVVVPIADGRNLYLGRAGAFRVGRTVADSFGIEVSAKSVLNGHVPAHWINGDKK
jgi:hypothetical protein